MQSSLWRRIVVVSLLCSAAGVAAVDRGPSLPAAFIPNRGQSDPRVHFYAQTPGASFWFTRDEAVFSLTKNGQRADLALHFIDAQPQMIMRGAEPMNGRVNYLVGNDRSRWQTDLPTYRELVYGDLWPGIDLAFQDRNGTLKYEFRVAAGADVSNIRLQYRGAEAVRRGSRGELVIATPVATISDARPLSYQLVRGKRVPVASEYLVADDGRYSFALGAYDAGQPLVIDPGLAYSTFLGGSDEDYVMAMAVDGSGNAYVTGFTVSPDFPFGGGVGSTSGMSAFVTKFDPTGTAVIYSTYVGGSAAEGGAGIAVDATGSAYVAGSTTSADFPTSANAYDSTYNGPPPPSFQDPGAGDAFLLRLNPAGNALLYSSYIGGSDWDSVSGMALDPSGNVYITGFAASTDFPVTPGAFDSGPGGSFVAKFDAAGSLAYSTHVSNFASDTIAADATGNAYVAGNAFPGFPTTPGAYATTMKGSYDIAVAKINAAGSQLVYSTLLPGSPNVCLACMHFMEERDAAYALTVDAAGNAYVTGIATAPDFPTTAGAFDTTRDGRWDAYVTKINPAGSALVYSTLLGGSGYDYGLGIALDSSGRAFVTGWAGANFPTTPGAFDTTPDGNDAFVTVLDSTGGALEYSTCLGGTQGEVGFAIATDAVNDVYVAGFTQSTSFPTSAGAYDTTFNGGYSDGFVTKFDLQLVVALQSFRVKATPIRSGYELIATFTLGASSDGIDPLTEEVNLKVGGADHIIPPGSFKQDQRGNYTFQGKALDIVIAPVGGSTSSLTVNGRNATAGSGTVVTLTIGNDKGMATVK
jgi:hypothetical protein